MSMVSDTRFLMVLMGAGNAIAEDLCTAVNILDTQFTTIKIGLHGLVFTIVCRSLIDQEIHDHQPALERAR